MIFVLSFALRPRRPPGWPNGSISIAIVYRFSIDKEMTIGVWPSSQGRLQEGGLTKSGLRGE